MSVIINGKNTTKMTLIQKEAKQLTFRYDTGISTATFALVVTDSTGATVISKTDTDFDKTAVATGYVYVTLDIDDLDLDVGFYNLQLKTTWNATTSVDKTIIITLEITESLF